MSQNNDAMAYEPEKLDGEIAKDLKKHEDKSFLNLKQQIESEYNVSLEYMRPKMEEWAVRLKLYNNQRRDKAAVGDPLIFTIHQTVLASLVSDKLGATFVAREAGDADMAEAKTALAEFDSEQDGMGKEMFDYSIDWDASFFGRGIGLLMEFDRDLMLPIPENIDPMTFLRDPRAKSVSGYGARNRGAMRFGGNEIRMTKSEMRDLGFSNYHNLAGDTSDANSLFERNSRARAEAQGMGDISKKSLIGENYDYRLVRWYTTWRGEKVMVTLSSDLKNILRMQKLKVNPFIDRTIYPISHDWDGVSIPDLVEDKQRGRSVVQNLGIRLIKRELEPRYLFDSNKIKNRAELNRELDKHIPVDGSVSDAIAVAPSAGVKAEAQWILDVLDGAAQRATATPEIQQGAASNEKRTLGELNLVASKVDTRYSLSARIFGWSEKRFWQLWDGLYQEHFDDKIDEKTIRVVGSIGNTFRTLKRKDFIGSKDTDIKIESKVISDAKRMEKFGLFRQFVTDAKAILPNDVNNRFALRQMGRFAGLERDVINSVLPPNIDELDADDENKQLNEGKKVEVLATDDHVLHIEIHAKAEDTPEKKAHIEAHRRALLLRRERPDLPFMQPQMPGEAPADASSMNAASNAIAGRKTPYKAV